MHINVIQVALWWAVYGGDVTMKLFSARCTIVQSAVLQLHVFHLSVCLHVTLVDQDLIGWKSWKLIARTISPTTSLFIAQSPPTYSQNDFVLDFVTLTVFFIPIDWLIGWLIDWLIDWRVVYRSLSAAIKPTRTSFQVTRREKLFAGRSVPTSHRALNLLRSLIRRYIPVHV